MCLCSIKTSFSTFEFVFNLLLSAVCFFVDVTFRVRFACFVLSLIVNKIHYHHQVEEGDEPETTSNVGAHSESESTGASLRMASCWIDADKFNLFIPAFDDTYLQLRLPPHGTVALLSQLMWHGVFAHHIHVIHLFCFATHSVSSLCSPGCKYFLISL